MSLLATLLPILKERFPDMRMRSGSDAEADIVFPAAHPDVGNVEIYDEGEELTLIVERFVHVHLNSPDKTVAFLTDLFADKLVLWRLIGRLAAGWHPRGQKDAKSSLFVHRAVWSGPL